MFATSGDAPYLFRLFAGHTRDHQPVCFYVLPWIVGAIVLGKWTWRKVKAITEK